MTTIPLPLRRRIEAVASELADIAAALPPTLPAVADVYGSLGRAINESRHTNRYRMHRFHIEVPVGCLLDVTPRLPSHETPRTVTITVL